MPVFNNTSRLNLRLRFITIKHITKFKFFINISTVYKQITYKCSYVCVNETFRLKFALYIVTIRFNHLSFKFKINRSMAVACQSLSPKFRLEPSVNTGIATLH